MTRLSDGRLGEARSAELLLSLKAEAAGRFLADDHRSIQLAGIVERSTSLPDPKWSLLNLLAGNPSTGLSF